jgi:hypothetical protein
VTVWLATGFLALAVAVACAAMLVARRLAPEDGFFGAPEPNHTGSVLAALGAAFAILTAFVLLLAFQSFLNAKRNADAEARASDEQYVLSRAFPDPTSQHLQNALICYARAVIYDEWPRMRRGHESAVVDYWVATLATEILKVPVRAGKDSVVYTEWFDRRSLREQGRRERLQEATPFVPPLLWMALIGGAALLVFYVCLFASRQIRLWPQLAVVSAVAAIAALNLSVVYFLDHPYEGGTGTITPSAMRRELATMERQQRRSGGTLPLPCNRRGVHIGSERQPSGASARR